MSENIAEKKEFTGSPEEIERQIETTRSEMGQTVDQLVDRLHPANQVREAQAKAQDFAQRAKATFTDALDGDAASQKKLGVVAGVVAGVLLLARLSHRQR